MSDDGRNETTVEPGIPIEEIDCPSGAVVGVTPWVGDEPGETLDDGYESTGTREEELQTRGRLARLEQRVDDLEVNDPPSDDLEPRVRELEHLASSHGDRESVQILDLRTRFEVLESILRGERGTNPLHVERIADLERALGMRNAENRKLDLEVQAVRATRDRAVGESRRRGEKNEELTAALVAADEIRDRVGAESRARGERVEVLERRVRDLVDVGLANNARIVDLEREADALVRLAGSDDLAEIAENLRDRKGRIVELESALAEAVPELVERNAEVLELRETVERTTGGFVDLEREINELEAMNATLVESTRRKDAALAGLVAEVARLRAVPTFEASAEKVVERVLASTARAGVDSPDFVEIPAADRPELIEWIEATFRRAAETPSPVDGFAVVYVPGGGVAKFEVEDFDDFAEATARFDELAPDVRLARLVGVVRRTR